MDFPAQRPRARPSQTGLPPAIAPTHSAPSLHGRQFPPVCPTQLLPLADSPELPRSQRAGLLPPRVSFAALNCIQAAKTPPLPPPVPRPCAESWYPFDSSSSRSDRDEGFLQCFKKNHVKVRVRHPGPVGDAGYKKYIQIKSSET